MFSQNIPSKVNMTMIGSCIAIGKLMILDNKKHQKLNGMNEIVPFEKDVFKVTIAHDNDANKKKRFPLWINALASRLHNRMIIPPPNNPSNNPIIFFCGNAS